MVDAISGGRLEFGIGSGNTEMDYKVFGVTRENDRQRLREAVDVILKTWGSERSGHKGDFWSFDELTLYPRPIQQPHPPEKVRLGVEAWKQGLVEGGHDPRDKHCQVHVRTHVNASAEQARSIGTAAVKRYDEISRIGRRSLTTPPAEYDWDMMLATGRNNYGNPDQCIKNIHNAMKHYDFDTLTTTFNFGGIPHAEILKSMRLFAREVMPAFR
jgi:alkanesulfonate monooxygenase SsuD/methylene tetrahydromethanopterin reductase-like flavin-dependent oxidoreductase (luciferase family)